MNPQSRINFFCKIMLFIKSNSGEFGTETFLKNFANLCEALSGEGFPSSRIFLLALFCTIIHFMFLNLPETNGVFES